MRELPTGTVTFLFTDIEGSTRLLHELGPEPYAEALAEHRRRLREAFAEHGGVEVDTQGDAFFVAFADARAALAAAEASQRALDGGPVRVRIGVHTGEPLRTGEGYVGADVHRAARIAAAANGGQVVVSEATRLAAQAELRPLGAHRLKDLVAREPLWQLGDAEFAPLASLNQSTLPVQPTPFLGRERELAEVLMSLRRDDVRILTLTGSGGTGKTRVAVQAAAELVDTYPHGVWWVPLQALRDPDLVEPAIAQAVGAKQELSTHLAGKKLLLLLDNFEQVLDAAPVVADLVAAAPESNVLVTSRERLNLRGEVEYAVPPFVLEEAVGFFLARARELRPDVALDDVVTQLARRLDGLPLALELAAARLKVLSPAQLLARLEQRLPVLVGGARDAPERQRTLRATIEWSYELLSSTEQQLFRRLSVFAGGSTLEAAEEVCAADIDTLQSLVEKSLVRFVDGRYWMLETIREFARERLVAGSDGDDVADTHASWVARFVERAESELEGAAQDAWLDRLETEHDNIRAALQWASDRPDPDLALWLAASSATFWWIRGYWTEGRRWLEAALSQSKNRDSVFAAKALEGAANLACRQLEHARGKELAEEGLAICRRLGDGSRTARMLRVLALAAGHGDDEAFRVLVQRSADAARQSRDAWALLMALNNLGYLALAEGEAERAISLFDEALQLARKQGDRRSEAFLLENLAWANFEHGMIAQAGDHFATSLRLAHHLRFVEVAAEDLSGIAAIAAAGGEFEIAARLVAGAWQLREEIGSSADHVEARIEARTVSVIERSLDPEAYANALAAGRSQSADELVELALGVIH